jgi:hypothetical protein
LDEKILLFWDGDWELRLDEKILLLRVGSDWESLEVDLEVEVDLDLNKGILRITKQMWVAVFIRASGEKILRHCYVAP